MSNFTPTEFLTPIGRMVWGSMYERTMEDFDGNPLKPNKDGSPNPGFIEFGLAIPKNAGEAQWWDSPLGKIICAQGFKDHPASAGRPDFSWKVVDGDSAIPGKAYKGKPGRAPKDKPGYPGNWVFTFRGQQAPRIVNHDGSKQILEPNVVMPGDCIQIAGAVVGNTGASPGVYLNYYGIAYQGQHRDGRIATAGPDLTKVGFGQGPVPAWVSGVASPTPGMPTAALAPAPVPSTPAMSLPTPGALPTPAAPAVPGAAPAPSAPAMAVAPSPGFLTPSAAPAAPVPAPAAPAAPAGPVMRLAGVTWDQMVAQGWTVDTARAAGHIV